MRRDHTATSTKVTATSTKVTAAAATKFTAAAAIRLCPMLRSLSLQHDRDSLVDLHRDGLVHMIYVQYLSHAPPIPLLLLLRWAPQNGEEGEEEAAAAADTTMQTAAKLQEVAEAVGGGDELGGVVSAPGALIHCCGRMVSLAAAAPHLRAPLLRRGAAGRSCVEERADQGAVP